MFFSYLGLGFAALGALLGGFFMFQYFYHFETPQVAEMHFRMGVPLLLGSILLGIVSEISLSLGKK